MKKPLLTAVPYSFSRRVRQQGVAAIEFALIAICMIVMLLGLLVWWHYFQTSQILSKAAGDGARAAHTLVITGTAPCPVSNAATNQTKIEARVEDVIRKQLNHSGLFDSHFSISNKLWTCPSTGTEKFSFDVSYQLPSLIGGKIFPAEPSSLNIKDKIVVHFPSKT